MTAVERAVADPITLFGVDVYVTSPPVCAPNTRTFEVRAKVNPFEAEAQLSELVTALAIRVREAGGNTLHSIRIISAEPFRGAEGAGSGATCDRAAIKSDLLTAVMESAAADAFAVHPRDPLGPDRTLKSADLTPLATLSGDDLKAIKTLVSRSRQARSDTAVVPSCPFVPNIGVRFGPPGEIWWPVSLGQGCNESVLMNADDDWRKQQAVPLDEAAASEISRLTRK